MPLISSYVLGFLAESFSLFLFSMFFFNEDVYGVSGDVNLITSDLFFFQSCFRAFLDNFMCFFRSFEEVDC